jgi:ribosomal protein L7/L12
MDETYLIIGGAVLVVAGIGLVVLRRSWGGSLDRTPMPPQQSAGGGLPNHPIVNVSDHTVREVQSLVARGNKIQAIKLLRDLTGMGLKEAKDYVESLPPGAALDVPPHVEARQQAISEQGLAEVRALMARGNKIEAIKRCRELTGLGLKEAKDFVESLPPGGPIDLPFNVAPALPRQVSPQELAEVRALVARGNKIQAIKRYRELTGLGLKEAKDYVDTL